MAYTESEILGNVGAELEKLNDSEAKRRIVRYFADKYDVKLAGSAPAKKNDSGLQGFGEEEEDGDEMFEYESCFGKATVNVSAGERAARRQSR